MMLMNNLGEGKRKRERRGNVSFKREGSYSIFDIFFFVFLSILRLWKGGLILMEG